MKMIEEPHLGVMLRMVLEIKGYDPSKVGLRQFLGEPETEVLGCLWSKGFDGGSVKDVQRHLAEQGCRHSVATVDEALKKLREMGVVGSRTAARSAPQIVYYPIIERDKLPAHLVGRLVGTLNDAMPEAMANATKKMKL